MTLEQSQVKNLYFYFYSEYSKKLDKLETERINKVKESEEYKNLINKLETFYIEIGFDLKESSQEIRSKVLNLLKANKSFINSWSIKEDVRNKLNAILVTVPQDTTFEDIVKLVDEKLHLEEIVSEHVNE